MKVKTKLDFEERRRMIEQEIAKETEIIDKSIKNTDFTQVYGAGWDKIFWLMMYSFGAALLYVYLAKRVDNVCGAVVISQKLLAEALNCSVRSIGNYVKILEETNSLTTVKLSGNLYAYCFDTKHLWTAWNNAKPYALFSANVIAEKDINSTLQKKVLQKLKLDAKHQEEKSNKSN